METARRRYTEHIEFIDSIKGNLPDSVIMAL